MRVFECKRRNSFHSELARITHGGVEGSIRDAYTASAGQRNGIKTKTYQSPDQHVQNVSALCLSYLHTSSVCPRAAAHTEKYSIYNLDRCSIFIEHDSV